MLVYRIENEVGNGPYRRTVEGLRPCNVCILQTEKHNHPLPFTDGIELEQSDFCGFQSLESLYTWFDGYIEKLQQDGFYIAIYKLKKKFVKIGKTQIGFRRDCARLVKYLNKD